MTAELALVRPRESSPPICRSELDRLAINVFGSELVVSKRVAFYAELLLLLISFPQGLTEGERHKSHLGRVVVDHLVETLR